MNIDWLEAGSWLARSALGATLLLTLGLSVMRWLPQPVTGKIADGKAQATEITVQDGAVVNRYDRVDAVPAAHADKVRHLIAISDGLRVER